MLWMCLLLDLVYNQHYNLSLSLIAKTSHTFSKQCVCVPVSSHLLVPRNIEQFWHMTSGLGFSKWEKKVENSHKLRNTKQNTVMISHSYGLEIQE